MSARFWLVHLAFSFHGVPRRDICGKRSALWMCLRLSVGLKMHWQCAVCREEEQGRWKYPLGRSPSESELLSSTEKCVMGCARLVLTLSAHCPFPAERSKGRDSVLRENPANQPHAWCQAGHTHRPYRSSPPWEAQDIIPISQMRKLWLFKNCSIIKGQKWV